MSNDVTVHLVRASFSRETIPIFRSSTFIISCFICPLHFDHCSFFLGESDLICKPQTVHNFSESVLICSFGDWKLCQLEKSDKHFKELFEEAERTHAPRVLEESLLEEPIDEQLMKLLGSILSAFFLGHTDALLT